MPIPSIQSFEMPLLQFAESQTHWHKYEPIPYLVQRFQLSDEEQGARIPSGKSVVKVRIDSALVRLKNNGLLENAGWGRYQITDSGRAHLASAPAVSGAVPSVKEEFGQAPEELLDDAYHALRRELAANLLDSIKECSPQFFERLVVDLMVKMGYGGSHEEAGRAVGQSGDGGIDGIIYEDRLGLDVIYLQAKRWENTSVGIQEIQKFAGALMGKKAHKGVFITTSKFTTPASDFAQSTQTTIVLIDGPRLADLMTEHGIGVTTQHTYEVKRINTDYFTEE